MKEICFDGNGPLFRANAAVKCSMRKFSITTATVDWLSGFEKNTGDLFYFFPNDDLKELGDKNAENFLEDVKCNWRREGFEIVEERDATDEEFLDVCFSSKVFKLRV